MKTMGGTVGRVGAWAVLVLAAGVARAEPVRNGNEVMRAVSETAPALRADRLREVAGTIHHFRYLLIKEYVPPADEAAPARLLTVEPSSALTVALVLSGRVSRERAAALQPGQCVRARGRIVGLEGEARETVLVDPAMLQGTDICAPQAGMRRLREVDPEAH